MISSPIARKRVAVFPASRYDGERYLLASIAELYPIDFVRGDELAAERLSAAIFFPEGWDSSETLFQKGKSCFRFARQNQTVKLAAHENVTFSHDEILHAAFRGATERLERELSVAELRSADGHVALAWHSSSTLWQVRKVNGAELHTVASAPPKIGGGDLLWSHLEYANWAELFPLLHFFQRLTADVNWQPAPAMGCFMFDDPNLHSLRYGYLDFAELLQASELHDYHVALATVPLDAWYAAPKVVELFRNNKKRLSLLMHGNNHVKEELAREYDEDKGLSLLAQALRRVAGFERRTELKVAKVIAPPHGGCSYSILAQMLRLPFEGVCTMASSLLHSASGPLSLDFGLSPTWFMGGGIPVVGRWDLRYGTIPLRLAAFLSQPIVPYGHHQDCAEGVYCLSRIADEVNSWESRTWTDMESILCSQYRTRTDAELMHIEMRSRRIKIQIPESISHVAVHAPDGIDTDAVRLWFSSGNDVSEQSPWGTPFPIKSSVMVEVTAMPDSGVDPASVQRPKYQSWPSVRRSLCIVRDRVLPLVQALASRSVCHRHADLTAIASGVARSRMSSNPPRETT
jgi:hypothetical protein